MPHETARAVPRRFALTLFMAGSLALDASAGANDSLSKIIPGDIAANDRFGSIVACFGQNTVVTATNQSNFDGAAYLYSMATPSAPSQLFKLVPPTASLQGRFGNAAALNDQIVAIGAMQELNNIGAVHVFHLGSGAFHSTLTEPVQTQHNYFGSGVGISGNLVVVGSRFYDGNGANSQTGGAYVYDVSTPGSPVMTTQLVPIGIGDDDEFGTNLAVSGNIAIIGARNHDQNGSNSGAAYLFDITTGSQLFKLLAFDGSADDTFGQRVAIAGNRAIVGASQDDDLGADSGSAYLYDITDPQSPILVKKLTACDGRPGANFSNAIEMSGSKAILGARHHAGQGAAYLFETVTGRQLDKLVALDLENNDRFGNSVGIGGGVVVIGSRDDDQPGQVDAGSAYVFSDTPTFVEPFCFGDGTGAACPCGAIGAAGQGCPNTNANGNGALLTGTGNAVISNDTFGFSIEDGAPSKPGILILGSAPLSYPNGTPNVPNASGIFCVNPVLRGNVFFTDATGNATVSVFQSQPFGATAEPIGCTTYYQYWFRDPSNPCQNLPGTSAAFNFSNAVAVIWQ